MTSKEVDIEARSALQPNGRYTATAVVIADGIEHVREVPGDFGTAEQAEHAARHLAFLILTGVAPQHRLDRH